MKHSYIVPTQYINQPFNEQSDFLLALSHLIDIDCRNEYAQAIMAWSRNTWKPIILDNGLYENSVPETMDTLLLKAHKIGAESVFAPDFLYDTIKTREALFRFEAHKARMEEERWVELPAINYVIQANNYQDYINEFKQAQLYNVNLIGLSILAIPKAFSLLTWIEWISVNRAVALPMLDDAISGFWTKKKAHLLWLGESLIDIKIAKQYPWIVSNDSCLCFWTWYKWYEFSYNEHWVLRMGKPKDKLDFDLSLTHYNEDLINNNIQILNSI